MASSGTKIWIGRSDDRYLLTIRDGKIRAIHQRVLWERGAAAGGPIWWNKPIWNAGINPGGRLSNRAAAICDRYGVAIELQPRRCDFRRPRRKRETNIGNEK